MTPIERAVRDVTAEYRRNRGLPPLKEIPRSIMATVNTTYVDINLTICGVDCEQEAKVNYLRNKAFPATVDAGVHVQAAEPESVEILSVYVGKVDVLAALTDRQVEAISEEILG